MNDYNTDAGAEMNYAAHDPQFENPEDAERENQREALDEVISTLQTARMEFEAVKQNFTTRKYNRYILALEQITNEVSEVRDDV